MVNVSITVSGSEAGNVSVLFSSPTSCLTELSVIANLQRCISLGRVIEILTFEVLESSMARSYTLATFILYTFLPHFAGFSIK